MEPPNDPELLRRYLIEKRVAGGHYLLWTLPVFWYGSWNIAWVPAALGVALLPRDGLPPEPLIPLFSVLAAIASVLLLALKEPARALLCVLLLVPPLVLTWGRVPLWRHRLGLGLVFLSAMALVVFAFYGPKVR